MKTIYFILPFDFGTLMPDLKKSKNNQNKTKNAVKHLEKNNESKRFVPVEIFRLKQ